MKHVNSYFNDYPTSDVVFETSDGMLFPLEGDARLHASSLKVKGVKKYERGFDKEPADPVDGTTSTKAKEKKDTGKSEFETGENEKKTTSSTSKGKGAKAKEDPVGDQGNTAGK